MNRICPTALTAKAARSGGVIKLMADKRRTTPALVTAALSGANQAGRDVVAADVHSGGFVRIYFVEPDQSGVIKGDNTCDAVFGGTSD